MRIAFSLLTIVAMAALSGCAGPESKLGRGLRNSTSLVSGGDITRSMEQTALWDDPNTATTTGFLRGFNQTMARTGIGIYEVVTFPIPPYTAMLEPKNKIYPDHSVKTLKPKWGGLKLPANRVYPASYKPGLRNSPTMNTDSSLGISGGELFPGVPGSRFRIGD